MNVPDISLEGVGKKFGKEWIFRGLNCRIAAGEKWVILGGNGSGKSTLLQLISGYVNASEGKVAFSASGSALNEEDVPKHISFASPYLQLVEDLTAIEMVEHAGMFKPFLNAMSARDVLRIAELDHASSKFIRQFSSGMKQRLKLGMALLADTGVLLLDEPVSNLDRQAIDWYRQAVEKYTAGRTVIVCSNAIEEEHFFCTHKLTVSEFKPVLSSRN